jgi:hypothetical protein
MRWQIFGTAGFKQALMLNKRAKNGWLRGLPFFVLRLCIIGFGRDLTFKRL